jgi:predicted  nucleic acid-binding Zn-ribbon protein
MSDEIDHLWALHGLDEKASTLKAELAKFPAERRTVELRLAGERVHLESLKARIAELQKTRRALEKEIETFADQERRFLSQQAMVKTNAEFQALSHEIALAKKKKSDVETGVLLKMEEEEAVHAEKPAVEAALKKAEQEVAERVARVTADEASVRERLEAVERERTAHLDQLVAMTRTRYERTHVMRDGRAVVPVRDGSCGGCFRKQPPQMLSDARRRDRVLMCDGCGRLLVWPPDAA